MSHQVLPEHMDRWSRNARVYQFLKGMGLFVCPVPEKDDPTRINHLIVSADLPFAGEVAEDDAKARVCGPAERPKLGNAVQPARGGGDNVVDFPVSSGFQSP